MTADAETRNHSDRFRFPRAAMDKIAWVLRRSATKAVMTSLGYGEDAVSVSLEEVVPGDWTEKVYKPDIMNGRSTLYKKPGYNPFRNKCNDLVLAPPGPHLGAEGHLCPEHQFETSAKKCLQQSRNLLL